MEQLRPYGAPPEWWRSYVAGTPQPLPRHPNRMAISSNTGTPRLLTIPLEGSPKRPRFDTPIATHGNWAHVHMQAIRSEYGRTPYYPFWEEELEALYADVPPTLGEFCRRYADFLASKLQIERMRGFRVADGVREDVMRLIDPSLGIIDALFRLGPRTTLALLPRY